MSSVSKSTKYDDKLCMFVLAACTSVDSMSVKFVYLEYVFASAVVFRCSEIV